MHRYEELERKYYKKKLLKYLILFFLLAAVLFLLYELFKTNVKNNKTEKKFHFNSKIVKNSVKKVETNISKLNSLSKNIKNKKTVKQIQNKDNNKSQKFLKFSFYVPKIKSVPKPEKNVKTQKNTVKKIHTEQKKKFKNVITVNKIKESNINVKELINSFNKQPQFDLAILISKYYYNKKDFANAKLWALKANNINPSDYRSWKMFALILLKKNDKIKAKEVLKIYLNDYGENNRIEKLLRSIDE